MGHVMYCYKCCILDRASRTKEILFNFLVNYGSRQIGYDGVVSGNRFP